MSWNLFRTAIMALVVVALGFGPKTPGVAHAEGCAPIDKVDGSTADTARKKMEQAGFQRIHDLTKGCDNFWHGKATKDGAAVNIVLSPQGQVKTEGE